ncbi:UBX domain-containing protein [Coniochaeta sp. 2T2.1]|nr:UBX domain-containing protein [Coniochaeta sp. 2T2.1]
MSAHVEVIATDLRRAKVKVTPGTFLVDVLREACRKLNLSSDRYLLKHKQKQLDLSVPFRTSGLSPGAKLELVAKSSSPTVINVALQFSGLDAERIPGGRLTGKFSSETTLWKVLRQFESGDASGGNNLNITARGTAQTNSGTEAGSGQLYYESPVLNIVGRELSTMEDLQKTLSQCGINSGSVLIRIQFQTSTKTLYEAMEDISRYMKEVDPQGTEEAAPTPAVEQTKEAQPAEASASTATDTTFDTAPPTTQPGPSATTTPSAPDPAPSKPDTATPAQPHNPLAPVSVFQAPTGSTPAAALISVPDTVYEPTIAHAQLHQARLLASSHNKRLKSDAELAAEAAAGAARLAAVTSLNVKVRFPDGTSAQWTFPPDTSGATLYTAVRGVMAASGEGFRLLLPGGKGVVRDEEGGVKNQLVKGYGLRGGVLLNLNWEDGVSEQTRHAPFLKGDVASRAQEVVVPEVPDDEPEEEDTKPAKPVPNSSGGSGGDSGGKKLPKWLKLGKK